MRAFRDAIREHEKRSLRRGDMVSALVLLASSAQPAIGQESWESAVRIEGQILHAGRTPIADVQVSLRAFAGVKTETVRRSAFEAPIAFARTHEDGRFELEVPAWAALLDVPLALVTCSPSKGFALPELIWPSIRRTHRCRIVVWPPDAELEAVRAARFLDVEGHPLVGVRVALLVRVPLSHQVPEGRGAESSRSVTALVTKTDETGAIAVEAGVLRWPWGVAIVEHGAVTIPVVVDVPRRGVAIAKVPPAIDPEGARLLLRRFVDKDRWAAPDLDRRTTALADRLSITGEIAGRVVGPGAKPVEGAEVMVVQVEQALDPLASVRIRDYRPKRPFAHSDASGMFRISHVPRGPCRLQIGAPEFMPILSDVADVKDGLLEVPAMAMVPGGRVPLNGGLVVIAAKGSTATIDLQGRTTLGGLPPGDYAIGKRRCDVIFFEDRRIKVSKTLETRFVFNEK